MWVAASNFNRQLKKIFFFNKLSINAGLRLKTALPASSRQKELTNMENKLSINAGLRLKTALPASSRQKELTNMEKRDLHNVKC